MKKSTQKNGGRDSAVWSLHIGNGGWVAITEARRPKQIIYIRFQPNEHDYLIPMELYVDNTHEPGGLDRQSWTPQMFDNCEKLVNEPDICEAVMKRLIFPMGSLSVLASSFRTNFGKDNSWVAQSRREHVESWPLPTGQADQFRSLLANPAPGSRQALTDAHYKRIAHLYQRAIMESSQPNKEIAEALGENVGTVRRWVLGARKRGFIPPTTQGARR